MVKWGVPEKLIELAWNKNEKMLPRVKVTGEIFPLAPDPRKNKWENPHAGCILFDTSSRKCKNVARNARKTRLNSSCHPLSTNILPITNNSRPWVRKALREFIKFKDFRKGLPDRQLIVMQRISCVSVTRRGFCSRFLAKIAAKRLGKSAKKDWN